MYANLEIKLKSLTASKHESKDCGSRRCVSDPWSCMYFNSHSFRASYGGVTRALFPLLISLISLTCVLNRHTSLCVLVGEALSGLRVGSPFVLRFNIHGFFESLVMILAVLAGRFCANTIWRVLGRHLVQVFDRKPISKCAVDATHVQIVSTMGSFPKELLELVHFRLSKWYYRWKAVMVW